MIFVLLFFLVIAVIYYQTEIQKIDRKIKSFEEEQFLNKKENKK